MTRGAGELADLLRDSVKRAVCGRNVAVAFSGGLDCGIVAAIAKEFAESVTLYTAGAENAYDVREAREVSKILGLDLVHIPLDAENVGECVRDMISLTGTTDTVMLSFEVPLYFVAKNCKEDDIIGGQGADEIFAGYSKYANLPEKEFSELRKKDIERLTDVTLRHEKTVAGHFGKTMHYPYLDPGIRGFAESMDIVDLMPGEERKTVLRETARLIGQPEISSKKKKAAQYGSGAMDIMRKIAKRNGTDVNGQIVTWAESE